MKLNTKSRIPKKGDIVGAVGHHGTFVVVDVHEIGHTVDIQILKTSHVERVTWNALKYADELDESQNAARIVKEATEDH